MKYILGLVFLWALLGCSKPSHNTLTPDELILAFGDSLTQGVGARETPYPEVLEALSGLRVINAGISGETTDQGLARLTQVLDQHQPSLLILLEGGNDILRNYSLSETKRNLAEMILEAQSRGIEVVLIGVPEKKLFSSSAELYSELAEEFNLAFDGDSLSYLLKRSEYKSDMVHLNDRGYQQLAENIYTLLVDKGYLE